MKFLSIGLEWWILYFLIWILSIVVCNHLARILGEIRDGVIGLHGHIEDALEELQVLHYDSEESSDDK